MRNYRITIIALALFACNSASEKTTEEKKDSTSTNAFETSVEATPITQSDLPKSFSFKGVPQDVWKWADKNGENIFFTTVVAPFPDNDKGEGDDGMTSELYAFHYIKKDSDYELAWQMKDGELSCPLDIVSEFIKGSATVTDLDKDGIAETKVQYALACHGDVSPSEMILIMQENKDVYKLQGNRWIEYSPGLKFDLNTSNLNMEKQSKTDTDGDPVLHMLGRYETERAFDGAPSQFLEYARNEWLKYVIQK
jgi:hypothetical protein